MDEMDDKDDGGPAFPNPALAHEGFCPSIEQEIVFSGILK